MTYSLVTDKGYCEHVNGNYLVLCKASIENDAAEDCRSYCTSHDICIGYWLKVFPREIECNLFPSEEKCPQEFKLFGEGSITSLAKTTADLVAVAFPGYNMSCYSKNEGKSLRIILH